MDIENSILLEDNHLLVVNKPAGLSSLPNDGMEDVVTILKAYIKERDEKPGNVFLTPVHRLDKQVSGILVLAKTSKAVSRMNEQIREMKFKKTYVAQLTNPLPQDEGELCHHLVKRQFYADVYSSPRKFSKEAILRYRHLHDNLYEIELETGRYHQIRAQMGFVKCPIIGDQKYGAAKRKNKTIRLHHTRLHFFHPITNEEVIIDSKAPFN
ncbi:RluA family pseudouridine synthase [bacterium]|nr:RluA family pseudouridine synthase [bacterium]